MICWIFAHIFIFSVMIYLIVPEWGVAWRQLVTIIVRFTELKRKMYILAS